MRIALYVDDGVGASTINNWLMMAKEGLIDEFEVVKAKDITKTKLSLFNWLILPGGSGSGICSKLTEDNRKELEESISSGLNVMGICAGMYALSSNYDWSLNLIPYQVVDKPHWRRGNCITAIEFSKAIATKLKTKQTIEVVYHNGPIVEPKVPEIVYTGKSFRKFNVLAKFKDDVVAEGGTNGLMPGSPAMVHVKHGKGNIIAISPHFEKTPKANKIIKKLLKLYM